MWYERHPFVKSIGENPSQTRGGVVDESSGEWRQVVLESLVRSSYLPPNGSNWDRDQLVFSWKLNLTRPNQYKPVIVG